MIKRYKEVWFGLSFGFGAILIDTAMHSQMSGSAFIEELFSFNFEMLVYRILFLAFGLSLGWLLWRNSRQERQFRLLQESFLQLHSDLRPVLVMNYSRLQILFGGREIALLSEEAQNTLRAMHADMRKLQSILERAESLATK